MNRSLLMITALSLAAVAGAPRAVDFSFHSGSSCSTSPVPSSCLGPLNVKVGDPPLTMPADGIFNYTTITVATGATLTFTANKLNTPVTLLASSDVDIEGTIDVSGDDATATGGGQGGPGGFQGGNPRSGAGDLPGDGHGPGGGGGGTDSYGDPTPAGGGAFGAVPNVSSVISPAPKSLGAPYGSSLLIPMIGGSGGGGATSNGGGGGGGGILIASDTQIKVAGSILANGGGVQGSYLNGGSGGGIRLVSPVVAGTGFLDASGGICLANNVRFAGPGRIRVDTLRPSSLTLFFVDPNNPTKGIGDYNPGIVATGSLMLTFPPSSSSPQLDIVQAAGTVIPVGEQDPVIVVLPLGASTSQTVKVQGTGFKGMVPIRVALFPDNGPASFFDGTIDMTTATGTPPTATVTVPVTLPVNTATHVYVWNVAPAGAASAGLRAGGSGGRSPVSGLGKTRAPGGKPAQPGVKASAR